MTEIERIKSQKILPEHFFREETRCDFLITEERKNIWAISLDLFFEFEKVCKKHNLKYYLFYGSLLGAVRHHGFIPWDDDFDVAMPRKDYEKLLRLYDEFSFPYFLQSPLSDDKCFFSYATLRNSNTSKVSKKLCYNGHNEGMNIDIFPIDICVKENAFEVYDKIKKISIDLGTYMRKDNPFLNEEDKQRVAALGNVSPLDLWNEVQRLAMCFERYESKYVWSAGVAVYPFNKAVFYAEDLAETALYSFEGFNFPIPIGFERILRTIYGDYKKFPPIEKRGTWHKGSIVDTDIPYKETIKKMMNN